jgi:CRISPR system Cascade subunit CasA
MESLTHQYLLTRKPVILVRTGNGIGELSLAGTFEQATDIRRVEGETAGHVFAQVRLLLTILLRAIETAEDRDGDAEPGERWRRLWGAETLPLDDIHSYLEDYEDRFDLCDPVQPFMQVADLRTSASEKGDIGLRRLIPDVSPNGLFAMRSASGLNHISYAEAARHLLYVHAYEIAGIHPAGSDARGTDPRAKGGRVYGGQTGPAGDLGGVLIEGRNLKETLLLNLVLGRTIRDPFDYEEGDDEPVWERDPLTVRPENRLVSGPRGQADLFTWQSRRVRLIHDGEGVTGAIICYGDLLGPQNLHTVETMSAFRLSENQSKLAGHPVMMPVRHWPSRAFWRGLGAFLPQETGVAGTVPPRTIEWLRELSERGILPSDLPLHTRAIGVEYGTQNSAIDEMVDDSLDVRLALLQETHRELARAAVGMVAGTENAVRALGHLAENLVRAAGGDRDFAANARDAGAAEGYALVDGAFRTWLSGLGPDTEPDEARGRWAGIARSILRDHAEWFVKDAGTPAWIGRGSVTDGSDAMNSSKALLWFTVALNKALPPPRRDGTETIPPDRLEETA